jgi:copper oxidase (laccase) domain-containing protein
MAGSQTPMPCTFSCRDAFFSFRRSQAMREPDYGRQISAIVLT